MQAEIRAKELPMPANIDNPRHLSRVLESGQLEGIKHELRPQTLILGLQPDKDELDQRIAQRVGQMFTDGLLEEARRLFEQYGPEVPALETPGYTALRQYLAGELTLDETKQAFAHNDRQLAKRQRTWFKRNNSIQWLPQQGTTAKSVDLVTTFLNTLAV